MDDRSATPSEPPTATTVLSGIEVSVPTARGVLKGPTEVQRSSLSVKTSEVRDGDMPVEQLPRYDPAARTVLSSARRAKNDCTKPSQEAARADPMSATGVQMPLTGS